jgi:tetratricopeptide (TPR) repeat protein
MMTVMRPFLAMLASLMCCLLTAWPAAAAPAASRSTVQEFTETIRTYPFSDPNPIPVFGRVYPYYRFDRYTDQPVDKAWKVVELENAYLRVRILPEIGGKVWTAIEKSTGRAFLYDNHVVKFRDVAMRGPWTSGGLEPNYGIIGHTPNCATPVDYASSVSADGTARVTVGTLDLLTRTTWRLEIALPADAAYFTTRSFWQNTSGIEQPYYTWMNAGIKAAGGLEFAFPGNRYIGHAGEFADWPMHPGNGKNLAFYDQNDFGSYKSYHVFGQYSDWWGAYWHDDDFGMARYSPRDDKLGKKIWIWGLSRQGMIWEQLLTDTDGQYVEVQSGRLFNQAAEASSLTPFKHRAFLPYGTDTWTEYWMPVKGTGGVVKANALGALHVRTAANALELAFSPVVRLTTTVEVYDGDTLVQALPAALVPMQTWHASIPRQIPSERLRIRIGGDRFEYSGDHAKETLARPVESPAEFDWSSSYGLALAGRELIRQREYAAAETSIDKALARDPHYGPALADKALLRLRAGDDEHAFEAARHALAIDTYDPQANYYYGLSALNLGRDADARDGFDVAAQDPGYRAAALIQLARLAIRDRRLSDAREYANRAREADHAGTEAPRLLAIALRRAGATAEAQRIVGELIARDPLDHAARFERYRLSPSDMTRRAFVRAIRNEVPHETFIELAVSYHAMRLDDDAREVLGLGPDVPEVLYWRAYLARDTPGAAERLVKAANDASPRLVFPFRPESRPVFTWAMSQGGSWKPAYYLALLVRGLGDDSRARELIAPLADAPDFPAFYAFRAGLAGSTDPAASLADLQRAVALDSTDWRFGRLLIERSLADGRVADAEREAARYHAADPSNSIVAMLHARTLLAAGRPSEALGILDTLHVLPHEGSTEGRLLYREAHLRAALDTLAAGRHDEAERHVAAAREWPERLGVGKPYPADADERLEDWLLGATLASAGRTDEARAAWQRILDSRAPHTRTDVVIQALASARLGRASEAVERLNSPEIAKHAAFATWARQVLAGTGPPDPPPVTDEDASVLGQWVRVEAAARQKRP